MPSCAFLHNLRRVRNSSWNCLALVWPVTTVVAIIVLLLLTFLSISEPLKQHTHCSSDFDDSIGSVVVVVVVVVIFIICVAFGVVLYGFVFVVVRLVLVVVVVKLLFVVFDIIIIITGRPITIVGQITIHRTTAGFVDFAADHSWIICSWVVVLAHPYKFLRPRCFFRIGPMGFGFEYVG